MRVVFVHGACVRDGAWWWHLADEHLRSRGFTSVAATLPSCGESEASAGWNGAGLDEDVTALHDLLTATDEPSVVVAHSYGGIVTAQAAAGIATVQHLLLISSYLPEPGESLSTFGSSEPAPFLDPDLDAGTFGVRPDALAETFLQDCPPEIAAAAAHRLARQSLSVTQQPVSAAAWQGIASTYLVCSQDRGTPEEAQRCFAARATHVVDIDSGHHPFLSRPAEVAELIAGLQTG